MLTPALTVPPPIELTNAEFHGVVALVARVAGIQLRPGKESLVRSRLSRRLRALGIATVTEYLELVERAPSRTELAEMIDALTTNKTSFFREVEHFHLLERTLLPALARRDAPIWIWSAGCSTGEEPYSVAMSARDALGPSASRVRILATDISARVLRRARAAEYNASALRVVAPAAQRAYFESVPGDQTLVRPTASIRELVDFATLNLMDPWPESGPFDVIFCRNVMIYFDKPTQERLVTRLTAMLAPGGHLMVGHSESLSGLRHDLGYVQPATYRAPTG